MTQNRMTELYEVMLLWMEKLDIEDTTENRLLVLSEALKAFKVSGSFSVAEYLDAVAIVEEVGRLKKKLHFENSRTN